MVKIFALMFFIILTGCGGASDEVKIPEKITASTDLAQSYEVLSFTHHKLEPSVNWQNKGEVTKTIRWYGDASVFLDNPNIQTPTLLVDKPGRYRLSVEFTSNQGKNFTASTVIIVEEKQGDIRFNPPTSLRQFSSTTLVGEINWYDENEHIAAVLWSDSGAKYLDSNSALSPVFTPTYAGTFKFTVQVTSNLGRILSQELTINVTSDPITFTYSPTLQTTLNNELRLNHTIDWHHKDETIKTISWAGEGIEFLSDTSNLTAAFSATKVGQYRLTQTVTSSLDRKVSAIINILVIEQSDETEAPIYTAPTDQTFAQHQQYRLHSAIDWQSTNEVTSSIVWSGNGAAFLSATDTLTPLFSATETGDFSLTQTITSSLNRQVNTTISIKVNALKEPIYTAPTDQTFTQHQQYTLHSAIDWQSTNEVTRTIAWSGDGAAFLSATSTLTPVFSATETGEFTLTQTITSSQNRHVSGDIVIKVIEKPVTYLPPENKIIDLNALFTFTSNVDWLDTEEVTDAVNWSGTGEMFLSDKNILNPNFSATEKGVFTLTQHIMSNLGRELTSTISITVNDLAPMIRPEIQLATSNTNPTLYNTTTLTAQVSDSDGVVTKVEFYSDNYKFATLHAAPYSVTVSPQVGTHRYTARVFDNQGTYTTSNKVTVTVNQFNRDLTTNIKNLSIKRNHPYLFVDPQRINLIKQKDTELAALNSWLSTRRELVQDINDTLGIKALVDARTSERIRNLQEFNNDAMRWGINAHINESSLSLKYAQLYIQSIMERSLTYPAEPDGNGGWVNNIKPNDAAPRGKLFALGALYDWIYDELSEEVKHQIRLNILANMVYIDNQWRFYSTPSYTGGHSRRANIAALTALLAIYHDIPNHSGLEKLRPDDGNTVNVQALYYNYLQNVISHFENGYNPYLAWSSINGGSEKGWTYGTSYSTFDVNYLWEYATDEPSWFTTWHKEKASFYLYGLRNLNTFNEFKRNAYHNFPYSGDVWATDYTANFQGVPLVYSATQHQDQHAQWLFENMPTADSYWTLLYADAKPVAAKAPTALPLSKHFAHAGFVTMRDSWQVDKNTLAVFKSSSFSSINHHHRDQNAFTIFYKGPLAIDSGGYNVMSAYGSWHWWNYYTRSVAHNTITVYDPNESFGVRTYKGTSTPLSNDGGQIIKGNSYPTIDDVKPSGSNSLGGIVHYQHTDDFTYTMGDASLAYNRTKVSKFNRHFIMLPNHSYNHPVYVIYDEVVAKDEGFKKSYLLHSINPPEVSGSMVKLTIDSGIDSSDRASLFQKTLLPIEHDITTIGGDGEEFLVWDNGNNTAHNYIEGLVSPLSEMNQRVYREAGKWRIEVSPTKANKNDEFLHVLAITDDDDYASQQAVLLPGYNIHPVFVQNPNGLSPKTLVAIVSNINANEFTVDVTNVNQEDFNILVIGLKPGISYNVQRSETHITITETLNGSIAASPQGTIYQAL